MDQDLQDLNTREISMDDAEREIDIYLEKVQDFLNTGELRMHPKLYMRAYTLIVRLSDEYDKSEDIYQIYEERLLKHILIRVIPLLQQSTGDSAQFLKQYNIQFKKFTFMVYTMNKIFYYLDKYFLKNALKMSLSEKALDLYRSQVFDKYLDHLRRSIFEEIRKDREDEIVDKGELKSSILQFIYMGFNEKVVLKKIEDLADPITWTC